MRERYGGRSVAFDGEGSAKNGQRWNARGVRAAYGSDSLALAALEYLGTVADTGDAPHDLVSVTASIDDAFIETLAPARLKGWDATPPSASVRFGTAWLRERRSVALRVPSKMIPSEWNIVLNPDHPEFLSTVNVADARPFTFDPRLLK